MITRNRFGLLWLTYAVCWDIIAVSVYLVTVSTLLGRGRAPHLSMLFSEVWKIWLLMLVLPPFNIAYLLWMSLFATAHVKYLQRAAQAGADPVCIRSKSVRFGLVTGILQAIIGTPLAYKVFVLGSAGGMFTPSVAAPGTGLAAFCASSLCGLILGAQVSKFRSETAPDAGAQPT